MKEHKSGLNKQTNYTNNLNTPPSQTTPPEPSQYATIYLNPVEPRELSVRFLNRLRGTQIVQCPIDSERSGGARFDGAMIWQDEGSCGTVGVGPFHYDMVPFTNHDKAKSPKAFMTFLLGASTGNFIPQWKLQRYKRRVLDSLSPGARRTFPFHSVQ